MLNDDIFLFILVPKFNFKKIKIWVFLAILRHL